jgi:hypothetical protein
MKMMTPVASKVSSRFARSRESPSGVGAPYHHMYLQCNLASMKVVTPVAKRVRRIRLNSSRESPGGESTLAIHVPAVQIGEYEGGDPCSEEGEVDQADQQQGITQWGGSTLSPHVPAV